MDILVVIDNVSLNYNWTATFITIKRWLVYWSNAFIKNNEIKSITFGKTFPNPTIVKIDGDKLKLENIISALESIIIKKTDSYDCKNIKYIFDIVTQKINKVDSQKYNDKIIIEDSPNEKNNNVYSHSFIFSSIIKPNLNHSNIEYINESLVNKEFSNISFFNLSKAPIFTFNNKIKEINYKFISNSQLYNDLKLVLNFNITKNNFNLNLQSINDIFNKLGEIEFKIYETSHWSKEPISKENTDIYFDYIDNLNLNKETIFENYGISNVNYIKSCINYVYMRIMEKKSDIKFNIPNPKFNEVLTMDYVIETIKFYNMIYPKMLCYHMNVHNKKMSFNLNKINELDFTNIKICSFENDDSTNYLYSSTTMTNWKQEYENFNPFGLFISYFASNNSYKGFYELDILSTYPNMMISSVSNNWISLFDYYQLISADIDIFTKNTFNINDYRFIDNLHGDSNIMLPIYINSEHWKLTKKYWSFHMSFINKGFEFDYNKKMDNIYFLTIIKNINNILNLKSNQNTIRLFFYILRTCLQICIDNKYSYNNKADYVKYFNLLKNSKDLLTFNRNFIDFIIRFIQNILTNNIEEDEFKENIDSLIIIYMQHLIKLDYDSKLLEDIKLMSDEQKNMELEIISTKFNLNVLCFIELKKDIIFFIGLMKHIYSIKKFNQLLKYLDKYNGCLPINEDDLNYVMIDNFLIEQLEKMQNIEVIDIKKIIVNTGLFS